MVGYDKWKQQAASARMPPALNEWTVCERNAVFHKITESSSVDDLPDDIMFHSILVPEEVDAAAACGTPAASRRATKAKRMRELPRVGPKFVHTSTGWRSDFDRWMADYLKRLQKSFPLLESLSQFVQDAQGHARRLLPSLQSQPVDVACAQVDGPIKAMEWQGSGSHLAICHSNDVVYVFDTELREWSTYSLGDSDLQTGVSCIKWAPNSALGTLAVGCRGGIVIWRMRPTSVALGVGHRPQSGYRVDDLKVFLQLGDFMNISAINWSPCGKYLIAGSYSSGDLCVWDIDSLAHTRIAAGTRSTSHVRYSPDGLYVLVAQRATAKGRVRIFETNSWTCKIINYPMPCSNISWLSDNAGFLLTLQGKNEIHFVRLIQSFPSLDVKFDKTHIVQECKYLTATGSITCGGVIDKMTMSPNGTRLVLSFCGEQPGAEYLLCFSVKIFGPHQAAMHAEYLMEIGYIHGPIPDPNDENINDKPPRISHLQFANAYDKGALLGMAWNNGRISLLPFYYTTTSY